MYKTTTKYRPKKRHKTKKLRIFAAAFVIVFAGVICYYLFVISPIICSLSEEKVRSLCNTVISQSVELAMDEDSISYNDLVHVNFNSSGEIVLIQNDTVKINKLVRRVTELVQSQMDTLGSQGIDIALGTFTGIPFLFGLGPNISLKLVPVGTVTTKFVDKFESTEINNTRHLLNFEVTANVGMILPAKTQNFETTLEVLVDQFIYPGKIPQVYLPT